MIAYEFIRNWIEMPKKFLADEDETALCRENVFFRFFCCFLALNHLYDGYNLKHPSTKPFLRATQKREGYEGWTEERKNGWRPSERERIMRFVAHVAAKAKRRGVDLDESVDSMYKSGTRLTKQVKRRNLQNGNWEGEDELVQDIIEEMKHETDSGRVARLRVALILLRIYQVRCNLFHGDKDSSNTDDYGLVEDGAIVLERFVLLCIDQLAGMIDY